MAFLAGLGARLNITLLSVLAGLIAVAVSTSINKTRLPRLNLSNLALLAFVASANLAFLLSLSVLAHLPDGYFLHAVALLYFCPLAYLFGAIFGAQADRGSISRIFHAVVVLSVGFVILTLLAPELVSTDETVVGSYYQYSGDCLALVALIHLATCDRNSSRWSLLIVVPILVMLGSRATVFAYGAALLFSPLLPFVLAAGLIISILITFFLEGIATLGSEYTGSSRVIISLLSTFIEGNEDLSLGERKQFQQQALAIISENPILGKFGYDYFANGYVGGFAHSALDIWAQYGVLAFWSFLGALTLSPIISMLARDAPPIKHRPAFRAMPLLAFLALEFALFRHPESVVLFFGMGVLSSVADARVRRSSCGTG
jgi:hypothetical protein